MSDQPPRRSLFIGRWQPLHLGHIELIRRALDEVREVVVGIMDTPQSERNPFTVAQREAMFRQVFGREMADGRLSLLVMPWIDQVCYGRACGWQCRRIHLDDEIERISGTQLRRDMCQSG